MRPSILSFIVIFFISSSFVLSSKAQLVITPIKDYQTSSDSLPNKKNDSINALTKFIKSMHSKIASLKSKPEVYVLHGYKTVVITKTKEEVNRKSSMNEISETNTHTDTGSNLKIEETKPLTTIDTAQLLLDSAHFYLKNGNYESASSFSNGIITHYPSSKSLSEAQFIHGTAAISLNDEQAALYDFTNIIKNGKGSAGVISESYLWLGFINYKNNKIDDAINSFNNAIKTDSTNPRIHLAFYYRANCFRDKELVMPAIINYTRFIATDPGNSNYCADAYFNRAFYKMRLGDDRGGIRDYDKALEIYKHPQSQITDPNVQREMQGKIIQVLIQRAYAKSNINLTDEAISDYNEVIKISPSYALAYRLRGLSKIKKGSKDDGCLDLSRAGELGSMEAYEDIKKNCK